MKKKIAILGSTGSIGKTLVEIIKKDKKNLILSYLQQTKIIKNYLNKLNILM